MASSILHIKDSYYFEVPSKLWKASYGSRKEFPDVWVSLDPDYQKWEAEKLLEKLSEMGLKLDDPHALEHEWEHWQHADHANHGKPFFIFLEEKFAALEADFASHKEATEAAGEREVSAAESKVERLIAEGAKPADQKAAKAAVETAKESVASTQKLTIGEYLKSDAVKTDTPAAQALVEFAKLRSTEEFSTKWLELRSYKARVAEYKADTQVSEWDASKLAGYNKAISGKILIPQPFGELRNFYDTNTGFCVSRFMIIEIVICAILIVAFRWLAQNIQPGGAPKGRLWNLLETFVVFIRDQVAAPAFGGDHGHDDHGHDDHGHDNHGHAKADHGHGHDAHKHHDAHHGHAPAAHGHAVAHAKPVSDTIRFTPLLCTIFFFVLTCNLFGMLPWAGAPTGSFSVTIGLAAVTLFTGMVMGIKKFGALGYLMNQIPSMDLPLPIAIFLKPGIFFIEVIGLLIKHLVLAIRLLANMFAGHVVLLGIMGVAFGAQAAASYITPEGFQGTWWIAAFFAVFGSALLSLLELFVAFLQAYIFTFLSALFIAGAVHKH